MKRYLLILLCCFPLFLFSQDYNIDSLKKALAKTTNITDKAAILSDLYDGVSQAEPEKAGYYVDKLSELAAKSNNDYVHSENYYTKSSHQALKRNRDSSLFYMKKALHYAEKSQSPRMLTRTNVFLGVIYRMHDKNDSALFYIDKAIELSEKYDDSLCYAVALFNKGAIYSQSSNFEKALEYYLVADSIQSRTPKLKSNSVETLLEIAMIFMQFKNYDKAETYANRALKVSEEIGYKRHQVESETRLAMIAYRRKEYEKAEDKFNSVLEYFVAVNDKRKEAQILLTLGTINLDQGKLGKANNYFRAALDISREINAQDNIIIGLKGIGLIKREEKKYIESQKYYTEALEISRSIPDIREEVDCLKNLAEINFLTNNYAASSEYYRQHLPLKDSLSNMMNFERVSELETQYETARKEQQIELLSTENLLAEQKRKSQFALFAVMAALMLIVGLLLLFAYRNKLKTAQKIKELNEMKSRFFANISHEFRTPLTLIKSPLQSLQSDLSDDKQQKYLTLIDRNADRMLELVNQLLELSKIDSGNLKLILKEGNIGLFLKSIAEPFEYQAKENGLKFSSRIEKPAVNHSFDKDVIEKIVANLLSNALKYTPEGHEISFVSDIENASPAGEHKNLKIRVSNSGSTLKKSDLPKLFERFYQKNEEQQGFGIGLAVIKELVELYKGKIDISLDNDILNFEISLPLTQNETGSIVVHSDKNAISPESQHTETEAGDELPVLLVVDDNAEIRNVLTDLFSDSYTVLEAENGATALKLAQKEIPDCIISDVMMPEMDGFQLTKAIKDNELTSFIPVILLTAKSSDETHLESLKSTADAFLTKPFRNDVLKETVLRQIAERKKLRERYSRELILRPVEIAINTVDEKFLVKLGEVMEKRLSDTGFSTDDFASELGMSRMQLHRKLKSLLNVSTTEFIRNERLKSAVELIRNGHNSVSEVAYTVGFNDISYFSKCFKELYGVTPTEYINTV